MYKNQTLTFKNIYHEKSYLSLTKIVPCAKQSLKKSNI